MTTYTTQQGDYWDLISYRLFGSEFYVDQLFKANTQHADVAVFAAGTVLNVPVINEQTITNLAPWERPQLGQQASGVEIQQFDFVYKPGFSYRFIERWIKQMNDVMYNKIEQI